MVVVVDADIAQPRDLVRAARLGGDHVGVVPDGDVSHALGADSDMRHQQVADAVRADAVQVDGSALTLGAVADDEATEPRRNAIERGGAGNLAIPGPSLPQ